MTAACGSRLPRRRFPGRFRALIGLLASLVVGLGLVGCGSGDSGTGDRQSTVTAVVSTSAGLPKEMPGDFGFILAYGVGARNRLDTFAGTFTKDMIEDTPVFTDLRLTTEELEGLYRRMVEIGVADYPRVFRPADTGAGFTPHYNSYYLRVKTNGRTLELSWADKDSSTNSQAQALRQLFGDIRG